MNFDTAFQEFKNEYNSSEYGIAERDFKSLYICKNGVRYKVVNCLKLNTGYYFVIYKKTPIKEIRDAAYEDSRECSYFAGEINRMYR